MKAPNTFPFDLHWTCEDLAGAMPLRLSELFDFEAAPLPPSANSEPAPTAAWRRNGYVRDAAPLSFRVR